MSDKLPALSCLVTTSTPKMDEETSDIPKTETTLKVDDNNDNGTKVTNIDISNNHTSVHTNDDEKENTIRNDNKTIDINGEHCNDTSDDVKTGVDIKIDQQAQGDTVLQVNEEEKANEGLKPDVDMKPDEEMKPDGDLSGEGSKPDKEISGEGANPEEGSKPDAGNNMDDEDENKPDSKKEESDDKDLHDMDDATDADKQDNGDENDENGDDANDNSDEDDPFAELDDVATMDLYNIGNYTFGKKDTESRSKAMSEMSGRAISNALRLEYERRGLRRSVRAVILVHEHNFPHILLLQRADGKGEFSLPGGRLRPGEDFEQGLLRKLSAKLCTGDAQAASASLNEDDDLDKDYSNDMDGSEGKPTLEVGDKCKNINSLKCEILFILFPFICSLVHDCSWFRMIVPGSGDVDATSTKLFNFLLFQNLNDQISDQISDQILSSPMFVQLELQWASGTPLTSREDTTLTSLPILPR